MLQDPRMNIPAVGTIIAGAVPKAHLQNKKAEIGQCDAPFAF